MQLCFLTACNSLEKCMHSANFQFNTSPIFPPHPAHPRLLAFVSHVGFQSLSEAAYHGVPLVAVPFFADQFKNSHLPVRNGWGIRVDKLTLFESAQPLIDAINEVGGFRARCVRNSYVKFKNHLFDPDWDARNPDAGNLYLFQWYEIVKKIVANL